MLRYVVTCVAPVNMSHGGTFYILQPYLNRVLQATFRIFFVLLPPAESRVEVVLVGLIDELVGKTKLVSVSHDMLFYMSFCHL